MLTLSSSLVSRYKVLKIISVASAAWVLGTAAFPAAGEASAAAAHRETGNGAREQASTLLPSSGN